MFRYLWLPLIVAGLSASPARAEMFPPSQPSDPPMGTSPSGFVGVMGPHEEAPEHYQAFPSRPAPPPACQNCPVSTKAHPNQSQADPTRH